MTKAQNSFGTLAALDEGTSYHRLARLEEDGVGAVSRLPFSMKILLEMLLRTEDGFAATRDDVAALAKHDPRAPGEFEIPFSPARVLLQDFTGVPCVVDLAAMRAAMARLGGDPERINPVIPVDLVIDHSVQVDEYGSEEALAANAEKEFSRNRERYEFLHWGQKAFRNFRVVPPASGICHQVNLEHLAKVVQLRDGVAFPDTLVGADSHTPMVNGAGVLGWGVGGIEAEAAMLGQPLSMLAPEVVGFRMTGRLDEGVTATDLVLTVTQMLRKKGVVGKFVEFYGDGLSSMSVPDRATISNMAPEYGATAGFFPVDRRTLEYLRLTGRPTALVDLVERYCRAQGLFRGDGTPDPVFAGTLSLDLGTVRPSLAGPKRPQDRVALSEAREAWRAAAKAPLEQRGFSLEGKAAAATAMVAFPGGGEAAIGHGAVVIAAITSCTNTSNPSVMLGAGLLAKRAVERGLSVKPWVKTSFAPGSKVVTRYLERAGLIPYLELLGFHIVGYGCTTCIGNSGPLPEHVAKALKAGGLVAAAVLSGNRNFDGRIHPLVKASYLASPLLVVAYALAGTMEADLVNGPIGTGKDGRPVFLSELWPTNAELAEAVGGSIDTAMFEREYSGIEGSNEAWNRIAGTGGTLYDWRAGSTYVVEPPFFAGLGREAGKIQPIAGARVLIVAGDSITTDHISPAGDIDATSPAGQFLAESGVARDDFNTYGSRRGNDRVMTRGTFANVRFRNRLAPGREGWYTTHLPSGEVMSIFEASNRYRVEGTPLLVLAGKDYGMGSSRDWAAKGPMLLGVRAVIAESFERIHRSNLVGMGILPLQFSGGKTATELGLDGTETFQIKVGDDLTPKARVVVGAERADGWKTLFETVCRIDTPVEVEYYRHGGLLPAVLRKFL